jgi:predicted ATPase
MSLKAARFDDHWRRTLARQYSTRLNSLEFEGLRGFDDSSVSFKPGITAIVGGNGVGKSTLAHATFEVLVGSNTQEGPRPSGSRLLGSKLVASVSGFEKIPQVRLEIDVSGKRSASDPSLDGEFVWLDPSHVAMLIQHQIHGDSSFADLLESVGPSTLSADELAAANFVVGKEYSELKVWEIQDYGPLVVMPYFRVRAGSLEYGSENMGRGELALLVALWTLNRVKKNAIVVIEEPETYVSSRSQDALMDLVAKACDERGLCVVVTTHSPVVIRRLPNAHVVMVAADGAKSMIIPEPRDHQIASILGGGVSYKNLLLTEDQCGKAFALALCEFLDPDLRRQVVAVATGGDSRTDTVLSTLPKPDKWSSKIVGIYDGDVRQSARPNLHWPIVFLPGNVAPEILLRDAVVDAEGRQQLALTLDITQANVAVAWQAATGLDHHDWHEEFARALGPDKATVTRALSKVWLSRNPTDGNAFISQLRASIG